VAADGEACSLLRTMDASCSALLRCVANVLTMRQLQRASPLPLQLPPPRVFDPVACVRRVVDMVAALDCVQPCLECSFEPEAMPPLPSWVVGDEGSIAACLQNLLITSLLWLPRKGPVRLHISTAEVAQASHVGLRVTAQPPPASYDLLLVISVETPGRALTAQELDSILTPFAMLPADKGGGTGLALYVTNGLARAMGGSLEVQAGRQDGTLLRLRVPLRVPEGATPPDFTPAAAAGPAEFFPVPEPDPARLLPQRHASELSMHVADAAELQLTSRMFNCLLASSDDIFAQCTLSVLQGEDAVAATAEGQPLISARIDYVSPAVVCRLAFSQADAVGLNILDVCHPGDRSAFLDVLQQAHAGSGPYGHRLMYVHRNVTADSRTIWCQTVGVCVGDRLYLVCRDMRTIRSVELALRAFTLATSHDMREPCNSILVALAVLERRPCVVTATAADEAAGVAAGQSPPMSVRELVACIRSACGLLLCVPRSSSCTLDATAANLRLPFRSCSGIVGNVLTAPQVESGELTLEIDVFSPTRLIMEVLQACRLGYAAAAHHAPVELESYGETLPLMVEGDRCRVAQVVQNLVRVSAELGCWGAGDALLTAALQITNAYKFGGNKPVRVQSGLQRGADGQTNLVVLVHDSGRGMSETEAASCFDAGQAAPAAAGGGTGLGLYSASLMREPHHAHRADCCRLPPAVSNAFARLMSGSLRRQV
jgi:signal transduction histidine kinase